jgi:uncharacterized membrane protein
MNPMVNMWMQLVFRWVHVVAGIAWIGHLYFFNFVNAQVAKTYDADSKKKVVPELMPRALYWFRWGAAYTWITGILLLGLVYYMGGTLVPPPPEGTMSVGAATGIGLAVLVVGFLIYDVLWKAMAKSEMVAVAISFVLLAGVTFGLSRIFSGRAVFIHVGALFGTIMAGNVWMRIWPAQRKIISGIKGIAPAADASIVAMAGLRSKHNTYMSVPLVFTMVSNHYPELYGSDIGWVYLLVLVAVGWGVTKLLYNKSANAVTARFEVAGAAAETKPAA